MTEEKKETVFSFSAASLPGGGLHVALSMDHWPKSLPTPENLKDLPEEVQRAYIDAELKQRSLARDRLGQILQVLATIAMQYHAQTEQKTPDNVVNGPWPRSAPTPEGQGFGGASPDQTEDEEPEEEDEQAEDDE